jgi:hypothetical protein
MGAISKNVISDGEWCAPTRELKNSKLLKLVHQTRKIISDRATAEVEVSQQEDVVLLVNRKPDEVVSAPRPPLERSAIAPISLLADGSVASYPVYRDKFRPLRLALAVAVPAAAVAAALFVFLAR